MKHSSAENGTAVGTGTTFVNENSMSISTGSTIQWPSKWIGAISPSVSANNASLLDSNGFVSMANAHLLPLQAFEIHDEITPELEQYTFRRSARRSVMLRLGEAEANDELTLGFTDTFDPYWKTSDDASCLTFIAVTVGIGSFSLSKAVAFCGFIPGFCIIVGLSCLHWFMSLRLVELPQFLNTHVENTGGIASLLWNRYSAVFFSLVSIFSWWAVCGFFLEYISSSVEALIQWARATEGKHESNWEIAVIRWACALFVMPFVMGTGRGCGAKDLQRASRYSIGLMIAIAVIEISCAITNGLNKCFEEEKGPETKDRFTWFASRQEIGLGFEMMLMAYSGIGILPHLIAEMLHPQKAKRVVTKASLRIFIFNVCMGMLCYLGWGNELKIKVIPRRYMLTLRGGYETAGQIISLLFWVKTSLTFPILFLPLFRETESLLELDATPAIGLHLPWALRQQQWMRRFVRIMLIIAAIAPSFLDADSRKKFQLFLMKVPLILIHYTFPAILPAAVILLRPRPANIKDSMYIGHNFHIHRFATLAVAVFVAGISVFNILPLGLEGNQTRGHTTPIEY